MQIDQTILQKQESLQYVDCHTHLLDYQSSQDLELVLSNALKENVRKIVVNTTTTRQFQQMRKLSLDFPASIIPGFGVHPYFVCEQEVIQKQKALSAEGLENAQNKPKSWIQHLQILLGQKNQHTVGQIGLDFRKNILEKNPKDIQMHYFKTQLDLAIKMKRPATIHCVRAHGQMLKIFKDLNKILKQQKPHFIMHSYGGSEEITKSMLKLNNLKIFFSLSLKRSGQMCSFIPLQNLLCQTDSPCQNNISLLEEQNRLKYSQFYNKKREKLNNMIELEKCETNEPVNVIANIKSLIKYYKIDQATFTKALYRNSLKAFKLLK